jgi:hypothetical protein
MKLLVYFWFPVFRERAIRAGTTLRFIGRVADNGKFMNLRFARPAFPVTFSTPADISKLQIPHDGFR